MGRETEWHFPKTCENCERLEERIKVLETNNNNLLKVASLSSTTIEKADKRIKALEDSLRWALDHVSDEYANSLAEYERNLESARKALEVKP